MAYQNIGTLEVVQKFLVGDSLGLLSHNKSFSVFFALFVAVTILKKRVIIKMEHCGRWKSNYVNPMDPRN